LERFIVHGRTMRGDCEANLEGMWSPRPHSQAAVHYDATMRLRIVHQLFLLLLGAVVLAVAAVGGVVLWNLRSGFGDYIRARDTQQMERLAALISERAASDPSMDWLRQSPAAMRGLMNEFSRREGLAAPAGPGPDERPDEGPDRPDEPAGPQDNRPNRTPPGGSIGPRTQIVDPQGHWIAGRQQPAGAQTLQQSVQVQGRTVAVVRVTVEPDFQGVDARFLRRQYLGLSLAGLATISTSLLAALLVARRWSQPLRALQSAAQRIARGEFAVRLPIRGAQEIAELTLDVNAMAAGLHKLENARRNWIAQISHELRTPLAVLKGELESIEDGARSATPELLRNLQEEVQQLIRLVNDLHTLAIADVGGLPCSFADGDGSALITRVAERFAPRLLQHGITLELHPAAPVIARWDFGRIEQLLTNLLENSLRYTRAPGRVRLAWEVRQSAGGVLLCLTVEDTPPGVPTGELAQLFEPLYRVDASRQRGASQDSDGVHGSGLGLSIARAIADAHHGKIAARASTLGGLAIEVVLPLEAE